MVQNCKYFLSILIWNFVHSASIATDDLVITLVFIKFRQPASIEILYKEPGLPRIHQFTLDSGIMWIPFGLIGLMPISLLVFANPNQGVGKQSPNFDTTTLQKFLKAILTQNRILTSVLYSNSNVKKVNSTRQWHTTKTIALKNFYFNCFEMFRRMYLTMLEKELVYLMIILPSLIQPSGHILTALNCFRR